MSEEGILVNPHKVQAMMGWLRLMSGTKVYNFFGHGRIYQKFVKGFSYIAIPLTRLTQKVVPFNWTPKCKESFLRLKGCLVSTPILVIISGMEGF